ncbi:isoleucine--tRNA ligase [Arthrobacter sulfonylureivorans]|uniref:Isoleucine--tRNA ligase n=1 Tax=Arthrobacter sulfonylureivorans TaxID=2486855 RepID=A0ABY3WAX5_9MICC|nr:isoleucine--tRNA ligase [Arthrobacter sulfonylureivorans]UNK47488.1 isoleucine--tRNA ligase [Arthrobacter sulfonylureivorans]
MTKMPQIYPKASTAGAAAAESSPKFPEIEELVLKYWQQDGTFQASVDARDAGEDGGNEFVFYDGPPFANGLPHYGHLLTGYVKDLVARYQTQRGHKVERRFGWDTHGLPAELEAMKQLGMTDKNQIVAMGIDKFNDACRTSVMKYADEWQNYVTRQARWVDFENDYKTLNVEYMESVIWAFKQLHEKGLTYQGFRVLPYCWRDETPLSNHELRMDDDVYKMRQDQTVTVTFPIRADGSENPLAAELVGVNALAWTTTPWTLPTNAALAVGPEIRYVVLPAGPHGWLGSSEVDQASASERVETKFLLAEDLLGSYAKDLGYDDAAAAAEAVTATYAGTQLAGLRYEPLWDYYTDTEKWGTGNGWQIVVADYVTTTDGTGLVHQAPAFGEDDQKICEDNGIPVIVSVDEGAKFLSNFAEGPLAEIAGMQVFEANKPITRVLKAEGRLVRQASFEHSYPHCWRCRTPLIYRAISSWYVEVTKFKDRMVELNQQINWIPENVKDGQFGKWLENARDWSISRNRFWGSPIPVWESDNPDFPRREVYGSLAELEEAFGTLPRNHDGEVDLHRPYIDDLVRPNPDDPTGQSMMRRVEDVLDVWFDSGSMPYAQVHYPMENKDWFDSHNPADFIVEYIGQTRGWFYTMHVLATALFDRPAFRNVISHGIVLGSDGQKMSKSLRNYPDVSEVLDRDGSDAMRWFLMASPILRGGNLIVTEQGIRDGVRQVMLPLWNVWHFFKLYTNSANNGAGYEAGSALGDTARIDGMESLDRFILANTGDLVRDMTAALDAYDVSGACDALREYLDTLTNWYIRRSRQRFFDEDRDAFDVLYTALETVCRVAAPLLPLVTEEIWRGLTGGRSVHLTDLPDAGEFPQLAELVELMDTTRQICSSGSSLRKGANLRVRLPLASLTVVVPGADRLSGQYAVMIQDELNIKSVRLIDAADASPEEFGFSQKLVVNARAAGPRLGKNVQQAIKAAKSGDWSVDDAGVVTAGGLVLEPSEYSLETVVAEDAAAGAAVTMLPGGGFLVLDTTVTAELEAEGVARDYVRTIQQARKDAGLVVSDRVRTTVTADQSVLDALTLHQGLVSQETLTVDLVLVTGDGDAVSVEKTGS